jgi:hypothetical protein
MARKSAGRKLPLSIEVIACAVILVAFFLPWVTSASRFTAT